MPLCWWRRSNASAGALRKRALSFWTTSGPVPPDREGSTAAPVRGMEAFERNAHVFRPCGLHPFPDGPVHTASGGCAGAHQTGKSGPVRRFPEEFSGRSGSGLCGTCLRSGLLSNELYALKPAVLQAILQHLEQSSSTMKCPEGAVVLGAFTALFPDGAPLLAKAWTRGSGGPLWGHYNWMTFPSAESLADMDVLSISRATRTRWRALHVFPS